jgi:hypothetical protein
MKAEKTAKIVDEYRPKKALLEAAESSQEEGLSPG